MRDHEIELIAALAEGRLEDESEARALVASSPEYRAEYEAQKAALVALSDIETGALTEAERSALRRDLWTDLRATTPAARTSGIPWYYRWASVAAGLFVVVGVVAVITQGGMTQDGDEAVSADMAASDTTQAASEGTSEAASETTAADTGGDTDEAMEEAPADDGESTLQGEALAPTDLAYFSAQADALRSPEETETQRSLTTAPPQDELIACVEAAGLQGYRVYGVFEAPSDSQDVTTTAPENVAPYIVAVPEGAELASAPIAFVDLETCEIVYFDEA